MAEPDRAALGRAFLAAQGLGDVTPEPLAQDASARRYFRLPGHPLLMMDAPPPGEHPGAFVLVTGWLSRLGARVPQIQAADTRLGFILLEDLGNDTFTSLLAAGASEESLYRQAMDALITMQRAFPEKNANWPMAPYDAEATLDEAALFSEWYLPARLGRALSESEHAEFRELWRARFEALPPVDPVLVHRDFHVDNLLLCNGQCAMLDYQDALLGSPVYDLASLLEDARRDVSPMLREALGEEWRNRMGMPAEDFAAHFRFWAAQRHAKVAGIFTRLWLRDGKPGYLVHLDRVMTLLSLHLDAASEMKLLRDWTSERLPALAHGPFAGDAGSLAALCRNGKSKKKSRQTPT